MTLYAKYATIAVPTITTQPIGADCALGDFPTALKIVAEKPLGDSGTLYYRWHSNTTKSTVGATPLGETAPAYTPPTYSVSAITYYYCVITNINGTVTSPKNK